MNLQTDWALDNKNHFIKSEFNASFIINKVHCSTCRRSDTTEGVTELINERIWINLLSERIQKIQSVGWIRNTQYCIVRQCPAAAVQTNTRWRKKGRIFPSGKSDLSRTSSDSQPASEALNSCIKCLNTPVHKTIYDLQSASETESTLHNILECYTWWHVHTTAVYTNALLTQNIKLNKKSRYFTHFIPPSTFPMVEVVCNVTGSYLKNSPAYGVKAEMLLHCAVSVNICTSSSGWFLQFLYPAPLNNVSGVTRGGFGMGNGPSVHRTVASFMGQCDASQNRENF